MIFKSIKLLRRHQGRYPLGSFPMFHASQCLRVFASVDRQQVDQHVSGNPIGHQGGKPGLQLVQPRDRPAI
jgi:hypothetical protein